MLKKKKVCNLQDDPNVWLLVFNNSKWIVWQKIWNKTWTGHEEINEMNMNSSSVMNTKLLFGSLPQWTLSLQLMDAASVCSAKRCHLAWCCQLTNSTTCLLVPHHFYRRYKPCKLTFGPPLVLITQTMLTTSFLSPNRWLELAIFRQIVKTSCYRSYTKFRYLP